MVRGRDAQSDRGEALCEYLAQKGAAIKVVLIAYTDPSEAQAKLTFDKLSMWYSTESRPAFEDSAYIGAHHAIRVLNGRVRYYVGIVSAGTSKSTPFRPWSLQAESSSSSPAREKQVKDLATTVAAEL